MSRSKISIFIILIAVALILVGCSADALQKSGESMGTMGNAGFGTAGESLVTEAAELVDGFIKVYEDCFVWEEELYYDGKAKQANFRSGDDINGEKDMIKLAASVVKAVQKATEAGASDKALKNALSAEYKGKTTKKADSEDGKTYRKFGDLLENSVLGYNLLQTLMILPLMNPDIQLDATVIEKIKGYDVPIPLQAYDIGPILMKAGNLALKNTKLITYIKEKNAGNSFDVSALAYIPEGIAANTGDRTYQTVGDKITTCLLYDIVDVFDTILNSYKTTHTIENSSDINYEELGFEWVLKNCSDQIDRAIADLNTIAYINGIHIDAAGLIGTYVSRI